MSQEWAERERAGIDWGDARLNKRSITLLERLADKPAASIPHTCNGWAETQAAYRFLARKDIGWEDILLPHSAVRCSACKADRWCCVSRTRLN